MRFEKLNENKIRIILDTKDLEKNNVDFHFFMSNPLASQKLFIDMLNKAEKELNFATENYNLKVEAIQVSTGDFILTITRTIPEKDNKSHTFKSSDSKTKARLRSKRKSIDNINTVKNLDFNNKNIIYSFDSFDDFIEFINFINPHDEQAYSIAKNVSLYEYKNRYFLVFSSINSNCQSTNFVFSAITEFGTYIDNTNNNIFKSILVENGNLIMKNNALKTAIKFFVQNA